MTSTSDWSELRDRAYQSLCSLRKYPDFLIIGEVPTYTEQSPNWKTLWLRPKPLESTTRYVQFTRDETYDHIYAECVGARSFGGPLDISPTVHQKLRQLGWLAPEDPRYVDYAFDEGTPNYRCHSEPADPAALADLTVATLDVLGLNPNSPIGFERE